MGKQGKAKCNMVTERRIGIFNVRYNLFENNPESVIKAMDRILVISAAYVAEKDVVQYIAYCDEFNSIQNEDYPLYSITCVVDGNTGDFKRRTIDRVIDYTAPINFKGNEIHIRLD